ncbi:MAG: hypothetical protein ACKPKO_01185 [Candidatus Fonsibacter sp.]
MLPYFLAAGLQPFESLLRPTPEAPGLSNVKDNADATAVAAAAAIAAALLRFGMLLRQLGRHQHVLKLFHLRSMWLRHTTLCLASKTSANVSH